jgi:5'-3' exoribonuclease 1
MGIPFFFKSIIQKYPSIMNTTITNCDRIFLDFNSIIHLCSSIDHDEDKIFKNITDHVSMIIKNCTPSKLIYIAVDGVAPLAKQIQQRRRRYLTAFRNNIINEFKRKINIEYDKWDSNCITPGTDFMIKLHQYLCDFYKDDKLVYISGHDQEGEGEHKIIQYIRLNKTENYVDVIYGLDADLIMLSLTCEKKSIFLLRESKSYGNIKLEYLDIDNLSKYIYEDYEYMYDYIFICFLLGNDFIPGLQFLKLNNGALDTLTTIYLKLNNNRIITKENDTYIINRSVLCDFFDHISKIEDELIKNVYMDYYKIQYHNRYDKTKIDKFINELDHYPIIHKYPENQINPINDNKWRQKYYHYLFNSVTTDSIKDISINYIEGLVWTTNYYFNMKIDVGWCYQYNYSPCLVDIFKYVHVLDLVKLHSKLQISTIKLNAEKQLLTVIPPLSMNIIPKHLQSILTDINSGCLHYYPHKFYLSTFLKIALHECIPVLPNIHFETLFSVYEKMRVML